MKKIAIIGSSGHAKVVADIVEKQGGYQVAGMIDEAPDESLDFAEYPILGEDSHLSEIYAANELSGLVIAIGDNFVRSRVMKKIKKSAPDVDFVSVVHPSAVIGKSVSIGRGVVVMAGVVVNSGCRLDDFCLLNTSSSLDHDSVLEEFSSLAPGVVAGGNCSIGSYSAIGIGASIKHGVKIHSHCVVGAGSVVLEDCEANAVYFGVPAKKQREREVGEKYL